MIVLARDTEVNVGSAIARTEVEGPGLRYALWVQGCPRRCPGCCNPDLLPYVERQWTPVDELVEEILSANVDGLTLLGGEPFSQARALSKIARRVRDHGMNVMVFTGYTLERLQKAPDSPSEASWKDLLAETDLLVDGPYIASQASLRRRWIGSENQRVHFFTDRCWPQNKEWPTSDQSFEIRLQGTRVLINGHPRLDLGWF